ncbi:MAG: signal peptidase I [Legionellales bacterium]|nr:signal peptidase I [Legionellales bacterium]|tara:strand:+ start:190 stop:996 length:807 start_codon:yes stop_codon:yes gene_type:complete
MNFDFSALLVFLSLASGLIWLIDSLVFHPQREKKATSDKNANNTEYLQLPLFVEYAKSFFPIFLIVLILRSFIFEPFKIPSGSMMPTLLIGDFILVNKFDYGLRLPVLHNIIIKNKIPSRGDIAVFRYPQDPSIPFIKRIIGLPGDKIAYQNKTLYINDISIMQKLDGRYNAVGSGFMMDGASLRIESLGQNDHAILISPTRPSQELEVIVPDGHYFVLGDNRDNSKDSRFWGFVPDENLVGRAFMIWMNWDSKNGGIDFQRIGTMIK